MRKILLFSCLLFSFSCKKSSIIDEDLLRGRWELQSYKLYGSDGDLIESANIEDLDGVYRLIISDSLFISSIRHFYEEDSIYEYFGIEPHYTNRFYFPKLHSDSITVIEYDFFKYSNQLLANGDTLWYVVNHLDSTKLIVTSYWHKNQTSKLIDEYHKIDSPALWFTIDSLKARKMEFDSAFLEPIRFNY